VATGGVDQECPIGWQDEIMNENNESMDGAKWYKSQLQTREWKEKRKQIYKRDGHTCQHCGESGIAIHCHHNFYIKGKSPWDYPADALVTLCEQCHDKQHQKVIPKFESTKDAIEWIMFNQFQIEFFEEELRVNEERVAELLDNDGITYDRDGQYFGRINEKGESRFYDIDGNLM
jgi:hypothetical protein